MDRGFSPKKTAPDQLVAIARAICDSERYCCYRPDKTILADQDLMGASLPFAQQLGAGLQPGHHGQPQDNASKISQHMRSPDRPKAETFS